MRFWLCFLLLTGSLVCRAQTDTTQPPFKRFPTYPPVPILLGDSTTFYAKADLPKGKPVFFLIFSPECSHCQAEATELYEKREKLKDVQIVMATMHPLWMMKDFITNYHLEEMSNVVVGKDINYLLPAFYSIHHLPFYALYNKKGQLVRAGDGNISIDQVADLLK